VSPSPFPRSDSPIPRGPPTRPFPEIGIQLDTIPSISSLIDVSVALENVTEGGAGDEVGAGIDADPGGTVIFLATTVESPSTDATFQYRFDFSIPGSPIEIIPVQIMPVSWNAGQNYAEVVVNLAVNGGTWQWILFVEESQPISFSNVTAVDGSALITVETTGNVDVGSPALTMAVAANFVPAAVAEPRLAVGAGPACLRPARNGRGAASIPCRDVNGLARRRRAGLGYLPRRLTKKALTIDLQSHR
jgi:hypothetical protein